VRAEAEPLDVAVVGGGAAGLYCAWRAAEAGRRTAVFEATDRIGGRLWTARPDAASSARAELGGIAVIGTHALVRGVTDELGLAREPLPGGDPADLLYLRGRRFRAAQWGEPDAVPYNLLGSERGSSPEELFASAVGRVVTDPASLSPRQWDDAKRGTDVEGRPLSELGLWNLLRRLLSPDAFRLIADAGGIRPEFQNWNAAEALVDLSQGWAPGARYERLRDGFDALPRALAERVRAAGGEVSLGHRLEAVEAAEVGGGPALRLSFAPEGEGGHVVVARRLVLALPQAGLQDVALRTPLAAEPAFDDDVRAVEAVPLFHLLLAYEESWWERLGIETGRSSTDLPIQTCFYLGDGLAMVGYSSADAIAYWDAYLDSLPVPEAPRPTAPPPEMLAEVTRQLIELHGAEVPDPRWARLMDWRSKLYGGASHRWRVGARSWETIPRMRRPLRSLPIHVCGEAWSGLQGWTEGAFRSAERVARDELGIDPPAWMSADAYLGP